MILHTLPITVNGVKDISGVATAQQQKRGRNTRRKIPGEADGRCVAERVKVVLVRPVELGCHDARPGQPWVDTVLGLAVIRRRKRSSGASWPPRVVGAKQIGADFWAKLQDGLSCANMG